MAYNGNTLSFDVQVYLPRLDRTCRIVEFRYGHPIPWEVTKPFNPTTSVDRQAPENTQAELCVGVAGEILKVSKNDDQRTSSGGLVKFVALEFVSNTDNANTTSTQNARANGIDTIGFVGAEVNRVCGDL